MQGRYINEINTAAIPQQSFSSHHFHHNQPQTHEVNRAVNENRVSIPQPLQPVLISGIPVIRPISNTIQNNGLNTNEGRPNLIKIKFNNSQ